MLNVRIGVICVSVASDLLGDLFHPFIADDSACVSLSVLVAVSGGLRGQGAVVAGGDRHHARRAAAHENRRGDGQAYPHGCPADTAPVAAYHRCLLTWTSPAPRARWVLTAPSLPRRPPARQ